MKYKKLIFICLIFFILFSISSVVYATEINDTITTQNKQENSDIIFSDTLTNDIVSNSEGTFSDLNNDIQKAKNEITLTKDYIYSNQDEKFINGINITKNIIINGNNHTINGNNQSKAFNIFNSKITLKNINFVNCNNSNDKAGGAIYCKDSILNIFNSKFTNNQATWGGAIYCQNCEKITIYGSLFKNNVNNRGTIHISNSLINYGKFEINNTDFINNTNFAIYASDLKDSYIINSNFIKNDWAVHLMSFYSSKIINVTFKNNNGCTLLLSGCQNNDIISSIFENNNVGLGYGGAIRINDNSYNNHIINSTFKNNVAKMGYALYAKDMITPLENCKFINNTPTPNYSYDPNNEVIYGDESCFRNTKLIFDEYLGLIKNNTIGVGEFEDINFNVKVISEDQYADLFGTLTLTINNEKYTSEVRWGSAYFKIKILKKPATFYNFTLEYSGYFTNGKYHKENKTEGKLYYISEITSPIQKSLELNMGENTTITAEIWSDYDYYKNGNISIMMGDKYYEMSKSKYNKINDYYGFYEVYVQVNYIPKLSSTSLSQTSYKQYHTIHCSPDYLHKEYSTGINIKWINSVKIEVNVSSNSLMIGEEVIFDINAYDCYSILPYIIFYDEHSREKQYQPNSEGKIHFSHRFLEWGHFNCVIKSSWMPTSKSVSFDVYSTSKISPVNDIIKARGTNINLNLNTLLTINDKPLNGKILLELNGNEYIFESTSNITFNVPKNLGTYNCKVTFQPYDKHLLNSTTTFKITSKIGTKITIKSVTGYQGKKVKLTATVKDDNNKNIKKGIVSFKVNGKTYKGTVKNGKASVTIKYPKARWYKDKSKFKGNYRYDTSYYKSEYTSSVTFKDDDKHMSSSATFKVTSKGKSISHKYRRYNYRTYTLPVTNTLKFYNKGSVVIAVGMKQFTKTNMLMVGVGDNNDHPIAFKVKNHYKKNGKWRWGDWFYCDETKYMETRYGKAIIIDKVKVNCYSPYYIKIY